MTKPIHLTGNIERATLHWAEAERLASMPGRHVMQDGTIIVVGHNSTLIDAPDLPVIIGPQRTQGFEPGESFYWQRFVGVEHQSDAQGYRHVEVPMWVMPYNAAYGAVNMQAFDNFDGSVLTLGYSHANLGTAGVFYHGEFVVTLIDMQEDHGMNASSSAIDVNMRVGLNSANLPYAKLRYSYGGDYPFTVSPFGVTYNANGPHYYRALITHNQLIGGTSGEIKTRNLFSFYDAKTNTTVTYEGGDAFSSAIAPLGSGGASSAAFIPLANNDGLVIEHYAISESPLTYTLRGWRVTGENAQALTFAPIDCNALVEGWMTIPYASTYGMELAFLIDTLRLSSKIPLPGVGTLCFGRRSKLDNIGDDNTAFTCYRVAPNGSIVRLGDLARWYFTSEAHTMNYYFYGAEYVGENTVVALLYRQTQQTPAQSKQWLIARSQDNGVSWGLELCNLDVNTGFNPFSLCVLRHQNSATNTPAVLAIGGFENQQGSGVSGTIDTYIWTSEDRGLTWAKRGLLDKAGAYDNFDQRNFYLRIPSHLLPTGNEDSGYLPRYSSHPGFFGDCKWQGTLKSNYGD